MIDSRITVAVLTFKRPAKLRLLCETLAEQTYAGPWRVVVIDNDPQESASWVNQSTVPLFYTTKS